MFFLVSISDIVDGGALIINYVSKPFFVIQDAVSFLRGSQSETTSVKTLLSYLERWQTVLVGLLTIIPAFLAALFMWKQVKEQRRQFLQIDTRNAQKSRMRLSANISKLSMHLDNCFIMATHGDFAWKKHAVSEDLLSDLLDAGTMGSEKIFQFFQKYIQKIQQYSSTCRLYTDIGGEENLQKIFILLGEIDILTDRLYPFARYEVDEISDNEIGIDEVRNQLLNPLRRGADISGTNLDELVKLGVFGRLG